MPAANVEHHFSQLRSSVSEVPAAGYTRQMVQPRHAFGPFILDAGRGSLQRNGKSVALGQRGMALLEALLDSEGGAVSKADLMERAWPGTIVEEGNLTVQIAALRERSARLRTGRNGS